MTDSEWYRFIFFTDEKDYDPHFSDLGKSPKNGTAISLSTSPISIGEIVMFNTKAFEEDYVENWRRAYRDMNEEFDERNFEQRKAIEPIENNKAWIVKRIINTIIKLENANMYPKIGHLLPVKN